MDFSSQKAGWLAGCLSACLPTQPSSILGCCYCIISNPQGFNPARALISALFTYGNLRRFCFFFLPIYYSFFLNCFLVQNHYFFGSFYTDFVFTKLLTTFPFPLCPTYPFISTPPHAHTLIRPYAHTLISYGNPNDTARNPSSS